MDSDTTCSETRLGSALGLRSRRWIQREYWAEGFEDEQNSWSLKVSWKEETVSKSECVGSGIMISVGMDSKQ